MVADISLLEPILTNLTTSTTRSWADLCIIQLNQSAFNWTYGLVDANGHAISGLTPNTWGVTYETCNEYCRSLPIVC